MASIVLGAAVGAAEGIKVSADDFVGIGVGSIVELVLDRVVTGMSPLRDSISDSGSIVLEDVFASVVTGMSPLLDSISDSVDVHGQNAGCVHSVRTGIGDAGQRWIPGSVALVVVVGV